MSFETWYLEEAAIQLIDGDRGKNYPNQSDFMENGSCLFLSAKNVTKNGFDFSEQIYVSKEKDNELRAGKLTLGDVVVTTRGTIGNVAFYDSTIPFDSIRINSGMMIFRADENIWNRRFLYFLLTSEVIKQQIISLTSGSAVPQLPARDLRKFKLPRMPLEIQNQIVEIIGSMSDKIELNRQINQTLEQIAQTIFKSWFVDFEPVKAKIEAKAAGRDPERAAMCAISGKLEPELDQLPPEQRQQLAATAALFPDELVESELGLIPRGWEVGVLADLCVLNAKSWSAKTIPAKVHYVDLANTKNGEISTVQIFSAEDAPSRARRVLRSGDTIIGTVRPGNRSFALIGSSRQTLTGSTGFAVLSPKNVRLREVVYILTTGESNIDRLTRLADGAAYPAVRPEVVVGEECVIPADELVVCFHQVVRPVVDQKIFNVEECETLATLRDTLLPRLLSGELRPPSIPPTSQGGSNPP